MAKCDCDLCKRNRMFDKIIERMKNSLSPYGKLNIDLINSNDIKWLENLHSHLMDVEESYDILKQQYKILSEKTGYKACLDGAIEKRINKNG